VPVRNFTDDRLPGLLDFVESINSWGNQGNELGRQTFKELLAQPGLDPSNNCLVVEEGGKIQGFCLVVPETPIGRTVLELTIGPRRAGSRTEREVIRSAVGRARKLGTRYVHLCLGNPSPQAGLLKEEGFSLVRTYWEMVWRQDELPRFAVPDGFALRSFQPGEAKVLTETQNAAFAGSWGFCPNTVEQIEYRSSMVNTPAKGILLLYQGDKAAGYCWTCIAPAEGNIRGVIGMIGVVPEYRGRGVSQTVLLAGMKCLKSLGVTDIGLQVDGANTPAIRLYTSVGFEKAGERYWFELDLSRGPTYNR
jgi:mycothiol synthase